MSDAADAASGVRTAGNVALTACAVLFFLDALAPRGWATLGVVVLAITGAGARIEAAVREAMAVRLSACRPCDRRSSTGTAG